MQLINHMRLEFDARPENESFARIAVSAFTVPFNPTLDVLSDIRTAISEAVTNAIVHAYQERGGTIALDAGLREDGRLLLSVRDWGFAVMQSFMDAIRVESEVNAGTTVYMEKQLRLQEDAPREPEAALN